MTAGTLLGSLSTVVVSVDREDEVLTVDREVDEVLTTKQLYTQTFGAIAQLLARNIGSRMDWKRDHMRALNQHKPCRRVRVAQLPMQYWPILWKFGVRN